MSPERTELKYACIGAGGIAKKKHLPGYSADGRVKISAVCDRDLPLAGKLAEDFGIERVYADYKEMIENVKPDIVSICTPNFTHAEIAVYALEHNCHVHVEKPMALNARQAELIAEAAEKSGRQVLHGLNKRYLGQTFLVQRLISEGFFGEIYKASCGWERSSGIPGTGRWFTEKALSGGGAMIDLGVHYLDLVLSFMGNDRVTCVEAATHSIFGPGSERIRRGYKSDPNGVYDVEDHASGMLRTESGAAIDFVFSWASNIEKEIRYVELVGTKGGFRVENDHFRLFRQYGGTMFTLVPDEATIPEGINECSHFISSVLSGKKVLTPAEDGVYLMKIIDALYRSAEIRDRVTV